MANSTIPPGTIDGATQPETLTRKATRSPHQHDMCCIFVHAGAGYHSHANERIHLDACNDAAQVGMMILRNGGSAIDAAEMAVKILEDREITNAGYGSNLAMDGVVECDASIVDHHGRSGAVGAVYQIKNPVSLARLVLNHTMQPLSLRRVPPNLLVGQGALQFAREMGMTESSHGELVSPAAKERWTRWHSDLKHAERKARKNGQHPACWKIREPTTAEEEAEQERLRREHFRNLLQEYSSQETPVLPCGLDDSLLSAAASISNSSSPGAQSDTSMSEAPTKAPGPVSSGHLKEGKLARPSSMLDASRNAFINSTQKVPTLSEYQEAHAARNINSTMNVEGDPIHDVTRGSVATHRSWSDGSKEDSDSSSGASTSKPPTATEESLLSNTTQKDALDAPEPCDFNSTASAGSVPIIVNDTTLTKLTSDQEDRITDTVGAIAVDGWGNIACAASSGGIGMKYRGRVGPAALVGIGTAVVPMDPDDPDETSVATVTSGTGEHMATTMAATVCAERLYQSVKKQKGGEYAEVTEDEALRSMIEHEFMGHPSVKNSNSAGAIGILGVKKTRSGVMLYYGHNTDSFAMASMHATENAPWCTMSRNNGNGHIAQGGRMMRPQRKKKAKTTVVQQQHFS